jgi:hypothetical protein
MNRISLEELSERSEAFDAAVMASGNIDLYCSSTDWILPATAGLMPKRESYIFEEEGCFWAFMRSPHPGGFAYLEPLEAMWALACPVVGADVDRLAAGIEHLCSQPLEAWKLMVLAGLPASHPLLSAIVTRLTGRVRLALGESSVRLVASLEEGIPAYLARRSKGFRRSLRRSEAKAQKAGIAFEDASAQPAETAFRRIIEVEKRGWKGRDEVGIVTGDMHSFYELMLPRLAARGAQQVRFATKDGLDIAYIMGGLRGSTYRGLQFSYDYDFAEYALGNLLQLEQMRHCERMGVHHYDLGMSMDYKRRWSDSEHETLALFVIRD